MLIHVFSFKYISSSMKHLKTLHVLYSYMHTQVLGCLRVLMARSKGSPDVAAEVSLEDFE